MAKDKINISLGINGQRYELKQIPLETESFYRDAATQINEKIAKYRRLGPDEPNERLIAMAALEISYENIALKDRNDTAPYINKLMAWSHDIDECLEENRKDE